MKIIFKIAFLIAFMTAITAGCSKGKDTAVEPSKEFTGIENRAESNRYLWGYWMVKIDEASLSAEIIPIRNLEGHYNVLKFLEQGPCVNCFKITGITHNPDETLDVSVRLKHPFPGMPFYTGFDVRGIAMFQGSKYFPAHGLLMSVAENGDGEILNPDGYTTLYNPKTELHGFEGYIKGNLANILPPNTTLNAYKRFASDYPSNTRNAFYAFDSVTRIYKMVMPKPPNEFVFGYAIDASWVPPIKTPVTNPMTDFPKNANCPEPWKIRSNLLVNQLFGGLKIAVLNIEVFDRSGAYTHKPPLVECPELFIDVIKAKYIEENSEFSTYHA
ncbi:MAG TPA: hypothetical protein ENN67_02680, partial [Firmicutes bacterium]|nr:hypothetical protein [Bacillota bacterium]